MSRFKYYLLSTATVMLISLTLHSCQHRLQVTGEEEIVTTPGGFMPSSERTTEASTSARKRSAEALSQDTKEKKESPAGLVNLADATPAPKRDATAIIIQKSQESTVMVAPPAQVVTVRTKVGLKGTAMASENTKDITKKAADEEDQKLSADLIRWFKEFVEAVDDEEILYEGNISEAIPRLVQEGKAKGYLKKSMKLVINEVGWEPDCTPLHYAVAKGNVQAVDALVREPEVLRDAQTEDNGSTPLHFAAYEGRLRAAERLISAYKSKNKIKEIDALDRQGTSALQYAALGPRDGMKRDVAELLVAQGADPTRLLDNKSPLLCLSASAGNLAMIEYWIEEVAHAGRFLNNEDKDFIERGIKLAKSHKHTDVVTVLQAYYQRMCVSPQDHAA